MAQDSFFLKAFAQAYALAMAQAADDDMRHDLQNLLDGVHQELQMHQGYAKVLHAGLQTDRLLAMRCLCTDDTQQPLFKSQP